MEEKLEQAYLYDFYGELLNEHQHTTLFAKSSVLHLGSG